MDYEKKYKEALERAREYHKVDYDNTMKLYAKGTMEYLFPELKESDDEKIWKEITEYFKYYSGGDNVSIKFPEWIAWLEKQGEQKQDPCKECDFPKLNCENFPCINKKEFEQGKSVFDATNEPKFKVGDWIVNSNGKVNQVTYVNQYGDGYTLDDKTYMSGSWCNSYHLWTIQDAKDGDVLATEDKNFTTPFVAIYKSLGDTVYDNITYNSRCFIGFNGNFYTGEEGHVIEGIHPATKEQRELLFSKMKEAGYEWDTEKKELKKIEPNPAWSDEDETKLKSACALIRNTSLNGNGRVVDSTITWLKSLKERIKL